MGESTEPEALPATREARNPKHETRNNTEIPKKKCRKGGPPRPQGRQFRVSSFPFRSLFRVSCFGFRISGTAGAGYAGSYPCPPQG